MKKGLAKFKEDPPPRRIPFLLRMPTIQALPPKGRPYGVQLF